MIDENGLREMRATLHRRLGVLEAAAELSSPGAGS